MKQTDSKGTSYSLYSKAGTLLYRETDDGGINYIYLGKKLIAKDGVIPKNSGPQHYRPFGSSIEGEVDDVGYTGHKYDEDLGLSYMQARYYDPVIGRFYSNDPVGFTPSNPVMSFNRYLYVNNNPYKYNDPDGEFLNVAFGIFVGAVGGGLSAVLNGGGGEEIFASAVAGGIVGGAAGATFGASLLATAATGAATGATSDLLGQTITNFDGSDIDSSSFESGLSTTGSAIGDAVSDVDAGSVVASGVLGAFGGVVDKAAKVVKFSDKATSVVTETNNALTSAKKDQLATGCARLVGAC